MASEWVGCWRYSISWGWSRIEWMMASEWVGWMNNWTSRGWSRIQWMMASQWVGCRKYLTSRGWSTWVVPSTVGSIDCCWCWGMWVMEVGRSMKELMGDCSRRDRDAPNLRNIHSMIRVAPSIVDSRIAPGWSKGSSTWDFEVDRVLVGPEWCSACRDWWQTHDLELGPIDQRTSLWFHIKACQYLSLSRYWCHPIILLINIVINNHTCEIFAMFGQIKSEEGDAIDQWQQHLNSKQRLDRLMNLICFDCLVQRALNGTTILEKRIKSRVNRAIIDEISMDQCSCRCLNPLLDAPLIGILLANRERDLQQSMLLFGQVGVDGNRIDMITKSNGHLQGKRLSGGVGGWMVRCDNLNQTTRERERERERDHEPLSDGDWPAGEID